MSTDAELTIGMSPFIFNASFCVELILLCSMTISAAQVNDYAHKIGTVLGKCPEEFRCSAEVRNYLTLLQRRIHDKIIFVA